MNSFSECFPEKEDKMRYNPKIPPMYWDIMSKYKNKLDALPCKINVTKNGKCYEKYCNLKKQYLEKATDIKRESNVS